MDFRLMAFHEAAQHRIDAALQLPPLSPEIVQNISVKVDGNLPHRRAPTWESWRVKKILEKED
jgi:hypothetical protein